VTAPARSRLVAGATFVLLGVLLMLDGTGVVDLSASMIPALLLLGLGVALILRR
jgi:hypothetical protein